MEPKALVLDRTAESLSAEDIIALCRGQFLAIHVHALADTATCRTMVKRLLSHPQLTTYPHAPNIGHIFEAFYESYHNPEKRRAYYDGVARRNHEFRMVSWPYLNPINHLQLLLDEIWPTGAQRENIDGRPMAIGLAQLFMAGAGALPHQDFLRMDEPGNPRTQTLLTQLTAIAYLITAQRGGELQLWSEHYNHEEFQLRRNCNTYGLNPAKIPQPAVVIAPRVGDLIVADSTKVHAVAPVAEGSRLALNCFIGFRGITEPLTYWS